MNNQFKTVADLAVWALIEEAELTPKPALVDRRGSGAHRDLTLPLMRRSARSLCETFASIAHRSFACSPSRDLREELAAIGRRGEVRMLATTHGCNSHRGALWALGLLTAGAMMARRRCPGEIASLAACIALWHDAPRRESRRGASCHNDGASHGSLVCARYGVTGARGEAKAGFPHVLRIGLPALRPGRTRGLPEPAARLSALLAIMASLDDTCLLHRGGPAVLALAKNGARRVLELGSPMSGVGARALHELDAVLLDSNASPGGAADLFAATLFLDRWTHSTHPTRYETRSNSGHFEANP